MTNVNRLKLQKEIIEKLNKNKLFTCKDVLSKTREELMKMCGESMKTVQDLMLECCIASVPRVVTAYDLLKSRNSSTSFLPTSLYDLDLVLHGGLHFGSLTEVAGPSGCGKTQFCMMMSALTCLSQRDVTAIYVDTESAFSAHRLCEMMAIQHGVGMTKVDEYLSRVFVHQVHTCDGLLSRLSSLEEEIIENNTRLVIVDSIASLVRKEYRSNNARSMTQRANFVNVCAASLKYLCESLNIVVLVTNQITTYFTPPSLLTPTSQSENMEQQGYVTTALGNTWSHCVNTRLILQYYSGHIRQILTAKSPVAPFASFLFVIQDSGLALTDDGSSHYEGTDPGLQRIKVRSALSLDHQV